MQSVINFESHIIIKLS